MLRGRNLKPTDRVTDDRDRALFAFPNSAAADFKVEEEEGEVQGGSAPSALSDSVSSARRSSRQDNPICNGRDREYKALSSVLIREEEGGSDRARAEVPMEALFYGRWLRD